MTKAKKPINLKLLPKQVTRIRSGKDDIDLELSQARHIGAKARAYAGAGRPRKIRSCPGCGVPLSARELRAHKCSKPHDGPSVELTYDVDKGDPVVRVSWDYKNFPKISALSLYAESPDGPRLFARVGRRTETVKLPEKATRIVRVVSET